MCKIHFSIVFHLCLGLQNAIQSGGRDRSVGIAIRYRVDGPGIESRWWRDFPQPYTPALRPTQPPIQWVPGIKRPERGFDHPPPSSAEVKERVELYFYSTSGPSWPVLWWTSTIPVSPPKPSPTSYVPHAPPVLYSWSSSSHNFHQSPASSST